jgi:hypothetical protein
VRSTYHPAFSRLVEEVEAARQEANDNVKFLKPLRKWAAGLACHGCLPVLSCKGRPFRACSHTFRREQSTAADAWVPASPAGLRQVL